MRTLYAGIDLHSNNHMMVVTDEEDAIVYRKRLRNELTPALEALERYRNELAGVAVESTYNWYWLVDGLMDAGYDLHLANTVAMQQYSGLKFSDDKSDARWLAKLLRLKILPEGYIYPKEARPIRDLLRKRRHLVRQRTSNMVSVQNLIARNTGQSVGGDVIHHLREDELLAMVKDRDLALAIQASVDVARCLTTQIELLEKTVLKRARLRDEYNVLLSVPGIGTILAMTIMLEVGDIGRFKTVGDFASYARCVNSRRVSNGKQKGKGNTKNGNAHLAWAFSEAAVYGVRFNETIQRYYQRKRSKAKHMMIARKTVAHKLARACYHMLCTQTPFDVERNFT